MQFCISMHCNYCRYNATMLQCTAMLHLNAMQIIHCTASTAATTMRGNCYNAPTCCNAPSAKMHCNCCNALRYNWLHLLINCDPSDLLCANCANQYTRFVQIVQTNIQGGCKEMQECIVRWRVAVPPKRVEIIVLANQGTQTTTTNTNTTTTNTVLVTPPTPLTPPA